jgi:hypothetical protein
MLNPKVSTHWFDVADWSFGFSKREITKHTGIVSHKHHVFELTPEFKTTTTMLGLGPVFVCAVHRMTK